MFVNLLEKDGVSFWKTWNSVNNNGTPLASRINGETNENDIANTFASYFESVYGGSDTNEHEFLKNDFNNSFAWLIGEKKLTFYLNNFCD